MTVSVILTVYNGEQYVGAMLDSLLFQIKRPDEIICVDDGSTDGSARVLRAYAKKHPFIKVFRIENSGSAAARIYGFARSTGEAVCFVDCDDTVDPDYISSLHDALIDNHADVAVGGYARETEEGGLISCEMMAAKKDIPPYDVSAAWINTALWNKMFDRNVIPEVTLPRIRQGDDLAYWCRMLPNIQHLTFVPKPMYHYVVRKGSQMSSFNKESFDLLVGEFLSCAGEEQGKASFDNIVAIYFISLCVSQLPRYYAIDKAAARAENRKLRDLFDQKLPGWRKVNAFRFGGAWKTKPKGLALYLCGKLFMWGWYGLFESMMCFAQNKLHFKAKW